VKGFALTVCAFVCVCHSPAHADEIQFTNGDRLTGKITTLKDGKVVVDSTVAGKVTLNWTDVATLSTDEPVTLQLEGGSVIVDKLVKAEPGTVTTAGNDKVSSQTIPLEKAVKVNPEPAHWTGQIVAGADIERGNTVKTAANLDLNAVRRSESDRITFNAAYRSETSQAKNTNTDHSGDKSVTASREYGELQYDLFFTKKWFGWANTKAEKDRVASLGLRFTAGVGAGYQFYETDEFKWSMDVGPTFISENFTDDTPNNNYIALRIGSKLDWMMYPGLTFYQYTNWYPSLQRINDQLVEAQTGLRYKIFGSFFGESKIVWRWDTTPARNSSQVDLAYILGIGYGF
jgi:putative salt-induced outer membrane protein YdiY